MTKQNTNKLAKSLVMGAVLLAGSMGMLPAESWQELTSRLFTNSTIVWQVPSTTLPKTLWVYHRRLPHIFPTVVVSNALVLGSLQSHGIPPATTNEFFIPAPEPPNWPGPVPVIFEIYPADAYLCFSSAKDPVAMKSIPDNETIVGIAQKRAARLGLAPAELTRKKYFTHFQDDNQSTNDVWGRGVFFPRILDGVAFFSLSNDGEGAEGYSIELGEHGKVQAFSVRWSEVERYQNERVASRADIAGCIRAHNVLVEPDAKDDYFIRLKILARTKKLTITRITPYYGEWIFGAEPTNDVPCAFAKPFAELEAVADLGSSNLTIKLLSPVLSSEVRRLLVH